MSQPNVRRDIDADDRRQIDVLLSEKCPPRVHNRNSISIGSAVFARLTVMTNTRRNHATLFCRPHLILYMQCGLIMATLMAAPNHIVLYKSPLPPGDPPDSYNRPTCHPSAEKLGPTVTRFHTPNGISIGSAVFVGLTAVTNRQTDRQTHRQTDDATSAATTGYWRLTLRIAQTPACIRDPASI